MSFLSNLVANDVLESPAQYTLAANPLVGVRGRDVLGSLRMLVGRVARHPGVLAGQYLSFLGELGRVATGARRWHPTTRTSASPILRGKTIRPTARSPRAIWRGPTG